MKKILILPMVVLWACGHKEPQEKKTTAAAAPPLTVQVKAVESVELSSPREAIGTVKARTTGSVAARIMAYVREVKVSQGDTVRAGQVLITLDSKDLDIAVRQAQAAEREAQSAVAEVESAIRAAKAQQDLAEVTFRRMKDLFAKGSVSNQEFDEAQSRVRLAQANVEMAQAKRQQVDARITQAQEAVRTAANQKEYTTIAAPFAGVVAEKRVEPGNLATPGAPLLMLEQLGAYRLEVAVDESLLPSIRRGAMLDVKLESLDKDLRAAVVEIVPSLDAATRTATVKLDLPGIANLRSGMSGRVSFGGESRKTLLVPAAALRQEGSLQMVFVVDSGVARSRMITVGDRQGDGYPVLSGLEGSEQLIAPLLPALRDGSRVEVRP